VLFFPHKKKDRLIEFQSRLLKELTMTAVPGRSQESPVRNIALAARDVLDVLFLFTYQRGDDERPVLHFFWCGTPPAPLQGRATAIVSNAICAEASLQAPPDFSIVNSNFIPDSPLPDIGLPHLDVRSKTFSLEAVNGNALAGIGLGNAKSRSPEDEIAVESILVALMNSIRSARVLATYTREVERFATRDPLTNLYNEVAFRDLLNYETHRSNRQGYKFTLMLVDLDNFKAINDSYGHDTGDLFLKKIADVLKSALRSGDIAARNSGDQFAAILPVCDEGQAHIAARRVLENVRAASMHTPDGKSIRQTVSIGVAVFPDHAREERDLYLLADSMLAQAKTFGKDRLSMPSEQDDVEVLKSMGARNILVLEALAQRQIVPYFQPIMNVRDRKIGAHEVLTRIVIDDRVIPAAEFIETAESMGAIGRIDYQLIEQTLAKVRDCGYQGALFLNLSPRALVLNEFIPTVRKLLRDYGIEPSKMVFEITERDTVKGLDVIGRYIDALKDDGFRFAIDDFGAGYSSFQYLRTFSIDFLKVDGDFIRHLNGQGTVDKAIVTSIASLSERLGIKTIAEYVESEDILSQVSSAGIDYAQGFHIGKPSPDLL